MGAIIEFQNGHRGQRVYSAKFRLTIFRLGEVDFLAAGGLVEGDHGAVDADDFRTRDDQRRVR